MIYHSKMTQEDNFKNLCNLTTSLLGLRKGSLAYKSRKQELQVARTIASVIARIEYKIPHSTIAKVINRDRTLIYHYEKNHKHNYSTFPKYRDIFNKVFNAFQSIEDSKKSFFDLQQLKDYLRKNDVVNSAKHQVTIRIQSGEVGTDVKVSYRNFYNQLELVKLALQNFKYEIEIITL
jgi:hypothetical protein